MENFGPGIDDDMLPIINLLQHEAQWRMDEQLIVSLLVMVYQ